MYVRRIWKVIRMTSQAWSRVHEQYELVRRILGTAERTGDPGVVADFAQEISEVFDDTGSFLLHLERQWYLHLEAALDELLDDEGRGPVEASKVSGLIARRAPMLHRILERHHDHPALADAGLRHPQLHRLAR